ncbi:binding-protein-dependent transport systems inner membrane component [Caldicellulosiruptor kronotskyensis 2002]|uniref:Binding-protein-dependent transport systems inner membrane component n=1 Tax=Caldicellulosiruptor kronotskyensis (strain DSM 18902 / VKM B-2412 / 2002) TaxID=632348 RepID=E4SCE6_CALK2|nr:sugar ABC transporter permease [Caldicellulosiruptor kronotskyensis]ADQ45001.1 binding-protein-dependent transport systems inner membrane component [Caldicellulosiruptor kronotskyensis 2002]
MNKKNVMKLTNSLSENISGWLILLPSIILFTFYIWEPMIYSLILSLNETKGFRIERFVGLQNYIDVLKDSVFHQALINTFFYVIWSLIIGFLVPIVVALIINEMVHLNSFFRFSIYFPNMVPGVAALVLWGFLFDPSEGGLLNAIRIKLGLYPSDWLQNPKLTIPLLIFIMTWKAAGSTALIYIARLQGINQELYEAACIDGAGIFRRIIHITLPELYSTARMLLIMQIIFVFQVLYEPLVLTGGGPNNASLSLMLLAYNYAFVDFVAGKSATVSVLVTLILMCLTFIYMRVTKENNNV